MAFTQEQLDNLADNNPDLHDKMWSKASDKLREEDSTNGKVAFSVFQSLWIHSITREMKKMGDKRDD